MTTHQPDKTADTVFCQHHIALKATPEMVRRYITDPRKVMDYYPLPWGGEVVESGKSLVVWGASGASLLEVIEESNDGQNIRLLVTSAFIFTRPFSPERIRRKAFFAMEETLAIRPSDTGCEIHKQWLNIRQYRLRFLPMGHIVRLTAAGETAKLQKHWR